MRRTGGKVWELETASRIRKLLASQGQAAVCKLSFWFVEYPGIRQTQQLLILFLLAYVQHDVRTSSLLIQTFIWQRAIFVPALDP